VINKDLPRTNKGLWRGGWSGPGVERNKGRLDQCLILLAFVSTDEGLKKLEQKRPDLRIFRLTRHGSKAVQHFVE